MRTLRRMSFVSAATAPERLPEHAIAGMLAVLRVMAERFIASFGAPSKLATSGAVYGKMRERILRWLHDMECVVRRLLLLRAALFPAPAPCARVPGVRGMVRRRKEGDAETLFGPAEDSSQWRVYFRMAAPPEPQWIQSQNLGGFRAHEDVCELGHRAGTAQGGGAVSLASIGYWVDDPRPLAERFEALLRVIADPDHYAARLAQRLYLWRGRDERRQLFLYALSAVAPFANEAELSDEELEPYIEARPMARALLPVFSGPPLMRAPPGPPPDAGP